MRPIGVLITAAALAGCAGRHASPETATTAETAVAASRLPEPPPIIKYFAVPEPLPLPGQLKPSPSAAIAAEPSDPRARVDTANKDARVEPSIANWLNAVQVYPFAEGALYQIYAAPGQVTDIALEPGEQLVGPGPVAAGDTVRWIIGDTLSGAGASARVHILLKPTRPGLQTNLVINTDRRTYHLELRSAERTYMASVSWTYPHDQLIALRRKGAASAVAEPILSSPARTLDRLNFDYRIVGDRPSWRPLRAFDDGRQVLIEFPPSVSQGELPPIWILGPKDQAQLVNYRVRGRFMIVDRLFDAAELRLGGKRQQRVRIIRDAESRP